MARNGLQSGLALPSPRDCLKVKIYLSRFEHKQDRACETTSQIRQIVLILLQLGVLDVAKMQEQNQDQFRATLFAGNILYSPRVFCLGNAVLAISCEYSNRITVT